jgi:hypothetical protein
MCLLMDLPFTDTGQAAEHVHHLPLHASGSATCRRSGVVSYATLQGTSRGCTWRPPARLLDPRGVSGGGSSKRWRWLATLSCFRWGRRADGDRLSVGEGRKCIGGERRCELHILSPHIQIACHICITHWRLIFDDVMHFTTQNGYACCFALCVGLSLRGIFSISSTISVVSYPKKIISNKTTKIGNK